MEVEKLGIILCILCVCCSLKEPGAGFVGLTSDEANTTVHYKSEVVN